MGPGERIQDETLDIDTEPGDPWLGPGVTCQIQRQRGCISTQARHKPADKMQGVGHGDKIIIIWNILIPVEDRPGQRALFWGQNNGQLDTIQFVRRR